MSMQPGSIDADGLARTTDGKLYVTLGSGSTIDSPVFTRNVRGVPFILGESALPFVLPSSGSIGNNGALSGLTALSRTIGKCYMYFAANIIASGVAAGWYYTEMSSTTAGTVYNNTYTSGTPELPGSKTAFSTTGPGAYTGVTANTVAISLPLAAGAMGANGRAELEWWSTQTGNANSKPIIFAVGASASAGVSATTGQARGGAVIQNQASQSAQSINDWVMVAAAVALNSTATGSVDTSAASTVTITLGHGTATDNLVLEGFKVAVCYSA